MIGIEDQEALMEIVANHIERDINCITIGGTAMMFLGYKKATKDIDLVFMGEDDRQIFINAIKRLGYKEMSSKGIYMERKDEEPGKPLLFTRNDERFDLFVKDVFGFQVPSGVGSITQRRDYIKKNTLRLDVLPEEYLILLKSLTSREKDIEDIDDIISHKPDIDWELIVDEAIKQKDENPWILIDLEETMHKMKDKTLVKKELFDKIYKAQSR